MARDAAQEAFYELDSAQRDALLAVETVKSAGEPATAARSEAEFRQLSARIDETTVAYIAALDAQDLDDEELDPNLVWQAKQGLDQAKRDLDARRGDVATFLERLGPVLEHAESQLIRVTPAVERAKQALLGATTALEGARGAGLKADELARSLAELAPELTRLNQGVSQHGVPATLQRAEDVARRAEVIRGEAEHLPERARELDRRVASLRTRIQALETRSETVEPALSELRRRFSLACWQDLQQVPAQTTAAVRAARVKLTEAVSARDAQRWADATAALGTVRALLETAEGSVTAVNDRLRRLNEVQHDPHQEIDRARFALRDAQRLAMTGRQTPDPRHAAPLDAAVARLDRAVASLEDAGRHPDYWHFLTELAGVRETAAEVVAMIRGTH
ncbi:hypothetical protein ACGFX4_12495 [Kitasatospora sp. NPDC048365]|uniref:hypothetical protein n=1 Tax=Kitasatospora sp. NPDC048365 TaxID=3364050 RepID=UPI00371F14FD